MLDGLFALARRLFGAVITPADGEQPVWHPDVRYFRVRDEDGTPRASFFLDPYSRPADKRGGAWVSGCLDRKRRPDGSLRLPVAYVVCNQAPPVDGKPSLMTFREVETLFHEFGHALQHMLTTVDDVDAAGSNNIEWDAVELPSQFMENWCYHRPTLLSFARHYQTGEPLPAALFDKISAARTYRAGSQFLRQLYFATLDLELHHRFDPERDDVLAVQRRVAAENTVIAAAARGPLPLRLLPHLRRWLRRRLLQLQVGRGAVAPTPSPPSRRRASTMPRRWPAPAGASATPCSRWGAAATPAMCFEDFRGRPASTEALLRHAGLVAANP